jgi:tetratricopeptide (TPR) repeat protein
LAINQVKDTEKLKAAYNNKGVVLMRLGNPSGAIRCFDEALKIDPDLRQATENKKECLDKLGLKLAANSAHIKT